MAINQSNTKKSNTIFLANPAKSGLFSHISFIKNSIFFFITGLVLLMLIKGNVGYKWVANDLIYENLLYFYKHPYLTNNQKLESKFGIDAAVIQQIRKATPDDAIILMPPVKVLLSETSTYPFMPGNGGIKNRNWAVYFLYPRKLIYADEEAKMQVLSQKATHVVCINGWGFDKITYPIANKQDLQILKLN